jgi:DNA-binding response OmpR family regulator
MKGIMPDQVNTAPKAPKKVLCIEDDHFIGDMYARVLRRSGFETTVISNGKAALEAAKQTVYDVILLDIMLPEKNGVEILGELRGQDGSGMPHTKIIVTTNFDEPEADRARLESMADGYVIKADITPNKLVEIITEILAND